jgi:hypothetical protein
VKNQIWEGLDSGGARFNTITAHLTKHGYPRIPSMPRLIEDEGFFVERLLKDWKE